MQEETISKINQSIADAIAGDQNHIKIWGKVFSASYNDGYYQRKISHFYDPYNERIHLSRNNKYSTTRAGTWRVCLDYTVAFKDTGTTMTEFIVDEKNQYVDYMFLTADNNFKNSHLPITEFFDKIGWEVHYKDELSRFEKEITDYFEDSGITIDVNLTSKP